MNVEEKTSLSILVVACLAWIIAFASLAQAGEFQSREATAQHIEQHTGHSWIDWSLGFF